MQLHSFHKDNKNRELRFFCGYDEKLDYVFMCVYHNEELIFSNLDLENALEIKDFGIFIEIALEQFDVILHDEHMSIIEYMNKKDNKD
ncbi:hypothetical protein ACN4FE_05450 [Aliarcobacter butzleri]|uniref:hypothetical protein n=1 Tax=Aliarcobacter butzleri TaxID=28197 RepID=UPI003AF89416